MHAAALKENGIFAGNASHGNEFAYAYESGPSSRGF
jgi:hypothetical protein